MTSLRPTPHAYNKGGIGNGLPTPVRHGQNERVMAITRKNFMFVGSDRGGDRAAIFYTLIESAKLNGLDPEAYIAAVINRMAKGHLSNALDALLPWNFKPTELKAA